MYYIVTLLIFFMCISSEKALEALSLQISQEELEQTGKKAPMKIILATVGQADRDLQECIKSVGKALEHSGQFTVSFKNFEHPKTKKEITELFNQGYALVIFINNSEDNKAFEWRLYDATEAIMFKGKKMAKRGGLVRGWVYALADELWHALTNKLGSFSTKLAFTKRVKNIPGKQEFIVCMSDYDGSHQEKLIADPGIYVGLYWNNDTRYPCLLCSEFTRHNVRLISAHTSGPKKVLFNFKGTCVGVSLSPDQHQAVYCRSGNIWLHQFDKVTKKGTHTLLIKNDGKNVAPTLLPNGNIIFCSDSKQLRKKHPKSCGPQICFYNSQDKSVELLTTDGYCVGPAYCEVNNKVAYSKKINGVMQLFICDLATKKQEQLTHDAGNKIDCCWSPCGNYILFCYQKDALSRIAVFNLARKEKFFITPSHDYCASPAWSCRYPVFPD